MMGKCIHIAKYQTTNSIHYYYVEGERGSKFYIGIEPTEKLVWFYKDEDFSKLSLGVIDFNEEYPIKSIYPLDDIDVAMAARRAGSAIFKGEFPEEIGTQS